MTVLKELNKPISRGANMKKIILLFLFLPSCAPLLFEENVERCVEQLLSKAPEIRYVDGKFDQITDFCKKTYTVSP